MHRHTLTFDGKMSELTCSHLPSVSPALWLQHEALAPAAAQALGWAVIHWPRETLQQTDAHPACTHKLLPASGSEVQDHR